MFVKPDIHTQTTYTTYPHIHRIHKLDCSERTYWSHNQDTENSVNILCINNFEKSYLN